MERRKDEIENYDWYGFRIINLKKKDKYLRCVIFEVFIGFWNDVKFL